MSVLVRLGPAFIFLGWVSFLIGGGGVKSFGVFA